MFECEAQAIWTENLNSFPTQEPLRKIDLLEWRKRISPENNKNMFYILCEYSIGIKNAGTITFDDFELQKKSVFFMAIIANLTMWSNFGANGENGTVSP